MKTRNIENIKMGIEPKHPGSPLYVEMPNVVNAIMRSEVNNTRESILKIVRNRKLTVMILFLICSFSIFAQRKFITYHTTLGVIENGDIIRFKVNEPLIAGIIVHPNDKINGLGYLSLPDNGGTLQTITREVSKTDSGDLMIVMSTPTIQDAIIVYTANNRYFNINIFFFIGGEFLVRTYQIDFNQN